MTISMVLTSLPASAADCRINLSKLPKCASGASRLVPKHLPAQVVFPPRMEHRELIQVIEDVAGSETMLYVSPSDLKELKREFQNDEDKRKLIDRAERSNIVSLQGQSPLPWGGYQRDNVVYGFDSASRKFVATNILEKDEAKSKEAKNGMICGIPFLERKLLRLGKADLGGNVQGLPGGACLIGGSASSQFTEQVCGPSARLVRIDTRYTAVNHVDEIFNVIPDRRRSPPCDFAILMASPERMMKVLEGAPNEEFLGTPGVEAFKWGENVNNCSGMYSQGRCYKSLDFCGAIEDFRFLKHLESKLARKSPSVIRKSKGVTKYMSPGFPDGVMRLILPDANAGASSVDRTEGNVSPESLKKKDEAAFPELYEAHRDYVPIPCHAVKNSDVVELLGASGRLSAVREYLQNKKPDRITSASLFFKVKNQLEEIDHIAETNQSMQKTQDENWEKIRRALPSSCSSEVLVKLPTLYYKSGSVNPNPTNLEVVGKGVMVPDQFIPAVNRDVEMALAETGLNVRRINTSVAHTGNGNVHCLSNEIRLCQP